MNDFAAINPLLSYTPDTGIFRWKLGRKKARSGDVAGCVKRDGYRYIQIQGVLHLAARLAFLLMTGEWPELEMDHEDQNKDNNKWLNLRETTRQENMKNLPMYSRNSSGVMGVRWNKKVKKWVANITVSRHQIYLGGFSDKINAARARKEAEIKYGFHPNHGNRK